MKKIITAAIVLTLFAACNGGDNDKSTTETSNTTDTKSTTDATDSTRGNMPANSQTPGSEATEFVMKAASGGMMEVQLGQMAQQKAQSQRVKDFAAMLVRDHSKANEELKSAAAANNITVPANLMPEHQEHINMMKNKSGADFDKSYMDMMVNDHKKDVDAFQKEAANGNDPFKSFAAKTLPVLKVHLDSAQAIHQKM